MKKTLIVFIVYGMLFYLLPFSARAEGGVTITPAFQEVVLKKDQRESSFDITVKNTSDTTLTIRPGVLDVGQLNDSGGVALIGRDVAEVERSYNLTSWVQFDRDVLIINPNEEQSLKATIINQGSLAPGGHYAAVVGYIENPIKETTKGIDTVDVRSAFSTLVFVKKEGGERYQLDVQRIVHTGSWFTFPASISLHLHNGGNVHVVPRGVMTILDPFGRTISKGVINEGSLLVLPETFRTMSFSMRQRMFAYVPGLYKLRLDYRYDGREQMSRLEEPILYIGWFGAVTLLVIAILSIFLIRLFFRILRKM